MSREIFHCQRCNTCCQGQGGIFLEPQEVPAAAGELGLTAPEFLELFCEQRGGRYAVLCDPEGYCRLLGPEGCRIHAAKPQICRLWPFFSALVKDAGAFEEAKLACPGIDPAASHADFVALARRQGRPV